MRIDPVESELAKFGLMIQIESPLHEGTFAYITDYPGSEYKINSSSVHALGKSILKWWSNTHKEELLWEGKGCVSSAKRAARNLIQEWKEYQSQK